MPRATTSAAFILLALAVLLGGCQSMRELGSDFDPRQKPAQQAYEQAIAPFTATGNIYQGPATELQCRVLALGTSVRRAIVQRKKTARDLRGDQVKSAAAVEAKAARRGIELVVSVFVPEQKWNNLAASRPAWSVFIQNRRGLRLYPIDRRRIKNRTPLKAALYPFWGQWDRLYFMTFPYKAKDGTPFFRPGDKDFSFVIAGAPGKSELKLAWD